MNMRMRTRTLRRYLSSLELSAACAIHDRMARLGCRIFDHAWHRGRTLGNRSALLCRRCGTLHGGRGGSVRIIVRDIGRVTDARR